MRALSATSIDCLCSQPSLLFFFLSLLCLSFESPHSAACRQVIGGEDVNKLHYMCPENPTEDHYKICRFPERSRGSFSGSSYSGFFCLRFCITSLGFPIFLNPRRHCKKGKGAFGELADLVSRYLAVLCFGAVTVIVMIITVIITVIVIIIISTVIYYGYCCYTGAQALCRT